MNNPYNQFLNNTQPQYNQPQQRPMQQQPMLQQPQNIVRVNGTNGASAYQMGINSSVLLLDETQPVVWLKTTDGAGYPTVQGYKISPLEEPKPEPTPIPTPVVNEETNKRISLLEEIAIDNKKILNAILGGKSNEQSNATVPTTKSKQPKSSDTATE